VNRSDFQRPARIRLREARLLLENQCYDGAYYLGGYAVECALKACIAKKTRRYDFPERDASKYYEHKLEKLALLVGPALLADLSSNVNIKANWAIVAKWTHESRYAVTSKQDARSLIKAVSGREGILRCIRRHW